MYKTGDGNVSIQLSDNHNNHAFNAHNRQLTCNVGTLSRNPLSVTSSTVSPMLSTSVALEKDTTM